MKRTTTFKLSIAVLITAALLGACGEKAGELAGETPTLEEVKAWRLRTGGTKLGYELQFYEVTDLKCGLAPAAEIERVHKEYAFMGFKADDVIKAYASCSYTVNAKLKGLKGFYKEGKDIEFKDHKVRDELFLMGEKDQKREWQGNLYLPKAS